MFAFLGKCILWFTLSALVLSLSAEELGLNKKAAENHLPPDETGHRRPLPLVHEVYSQAVQAAARSDTGRAGELISAGLSLDPRHQKLLALRLDLAIAQADDTIIAETLGHLRRIDPRDGAGYDAALAELYQRPSARSAIEGFIVREPENARSLRASLARSAQIDNSLLAILEGAPEFSELLFRLVREQRYEEAFAFWFSELSPEQRRELTIPSNQELTKEANRRDPFHWQLDPRQSEWLNEGGVFVSTPGNKPIIHIRQLLMAGPGHYQWKAELSGRMQENGARFIWRFECLTDRLWSESLEITQLSDAPEIKWWSVELKKECGAYELQLRSEPGVFPFLARAELTSVHIEKIETESAGNGS